MSDIVERLRKGIEWTGPTQDDTGQTENLMDEAADEITSLRAKVETLEADLAFADQETAKVENLFLGTVKKAEKLKGLLKRHNDLSGKPECALGYEEKCPGPCTCGWDEWFIETHALARETRAALGDTHER